MKAAELRKLCKTPASLLNLSHVKIDLISIMDCERYSDIHKLLRITCLVLRFVNSLKKLISKQPKVSGPLSTEEIRQAEEKWLISVQASLLSNPKYPQWCKQLGLFVDKRGFIRFKGRIENADLPCNTRYPVLLPQGHFTELLMLAAHRRVGHNCVKETLSELRFRFWIIMGRKFVRRALLGYSWCNKFEDSSYKAHVSAPLPEFRLRDDPALSSTGADYAGFLYVYGSVERQEESSKVYMLLYTSASSRAVHLDLTPDLTADAFLRSIRIFVSRRIIPCLIRIEKVSDTV